MCAVSPPSASVPGGGKQPVQLAKRRHTLLNSLCNRYAGKASARRRRTLVSLRPLRTLYSSSSTCTKVMEEVTPAGKPIVDREKVCFVRRSLYTSGPHRCAQTAPFLIRTFVKIGTYHRLNQFEDGPLPVADEQQIYTWCVPPRHTTIPHLPTDTHFIPQARRHAPRGAYDAAVRRAQLDRVPTPTRAVLLPRRLRRLRLPRPLLPKRPRHGLLARRPRRARLT